MSRPGLIPVIATTLALGVVGCTASSPEAASAPTASVDPSSSESGATKLTGEDAKQALIALIRAQPDLFAGEPDPDRFAALPVTERSEPGTYQLGRFVIDTSARTYHAWIELPAHVYFYDGCFEVEAGGWVATPPREMRGTPDRPR